MRKTWKTLQVDKETHRQVAQIAKMTDRSVNWVARRLLSFAASNCWTFPDDDGKRFFKRDEVQMIFEVRNCEEN